jgi:hypothetical protein
MPGICGGGIIPGIRGDLRQTLENMRRFYRFDKKTDFSPSVVLFSCYLHSYVWI